MKFRNAIFGTVGFTFLLMSVAVQPARAYIEIPYTLGRVIQDSGYILVLQVEKVEKTKNLIIYRKVQDLKGVWPQEIIRHNIGQNGFHEREWRAIMEWAEPGKIAVFFHKDNASEMCIDNYWYQAYAGGDWWNMSHGEPFLLRTFSGKPEKIIPAVQAILTGGEVIVPCMSDGDKMALHLRTGKIQRLKASLKLQDYNTQRDFVGWGGDDLRRVAGMPGFTHLGTLGRVDPETLGALSIDFDHNKKPDFMLFGANRIALFHNAGTSFNEMGIPYSGGARGASWSDYNGDGLPDLLLATPVGPRLFTNLGKGRFRDDTVCLPPDALYHANACAWIDYNGDKKPDILLANGYLGLRLYKNICDPNSVTAGAPPKMGPWKYIGPFDNPGGNGAFDAVLPPEREIDFSKEYPGRKGEKAVWKDGNFPDGQVNNLRLFREDTNDDAVCYVYREIEAKTEMELPVSLGSDDFLKVFLNGRPIFGENVQRGCAADQCKITLKLAAGKNQLLLKVGNGAADWAFYFQPGEPILSPRQLFEDVSVQAGFGPNGIASKQKIEHLDSADFNGDGRPDILISAGTGILALNADQGFAEVKNAGLNYQTKMFKPVLADFSGSGYLDVLVPQGNALVLFRNNGRGRFVDATAVSGDLKRPIRNAVCACAASPSKSGKPDLFVGCLNGPNKYFRNSGDGTFVEATVEIGLHQKTFNTRAVVAADLNGDSAIDLILGNEGQDSAVLIGAKREPTAKP